MAGFFNPSTPATLGLEWLVSEDPSTFVLDSASKSYGMYLTGAALKRSQELAVWAELLSGTGVFGCECLSAPYTESIPQSFTTCYAGTDTGGEFTSPTNGANAWLTQAGGAATYASVSPGVDDVIYLRNINQVEGPTPARLMMRGIGAQTVLAGRRILDVTVYARIKSTLQTSPTVFGCLNISSIDYVASAVVVPTGQGYNNLTLGKWSLNPSTMKPWTVPELNLIVTTGGTDEFGFLATWDARYTATYSDTIRIASVYIVVRWQPEDRVGYASALVTATGWQTWTAKSVPNLLTKQDSNLDTDTAVTGTWVADANTTATNDTDDPGGAWSRSLKLLSGAAGAFGALSGFYPAIAGKTYSVRGRAKTTAGRTTVMSILFYDSLGTLLQTSASAGDAGTGAYISIGMTAVVTAPTGATQMKVHIVTTATAGAQTTFITGIFVGLAQTAITYVREASPGGAAPTKVDGSAETSSIAHSVSELRIFRRISGTGTLSLVTIGPGASAVGMPLSEYSYRPTLQDVAGALLSLGSVGTDVTAVITTSLNGWDSANGPIASLSQPYARRISGKVNTGNTIQSEMTLPATTYLAFRLVVSGEIDTPAASLTLKLKRRSDNAQAGGTATIAATDLVQIIPPGGSVASRTTPQVFVVAIPTPGANTAVQYYVELASTAAAGSGWLVYALDDMGYTGDSVSVDTIIFGANVDAWTDPLDGGELARRNGMITVQTQPTAPTGLLATVLGAKVTVSWTLTSLGATFAAMEIWRSNDRTGIDSDGYVQVADLTTESVHSWPDGEVRRGVPVTYKIRIRRTDGSLSDFSAASTVKTIDAAFGPEWYITSNEVAQTSWIGAELLGDRVYQPPIQRVLREFYGRDGAVAFIPIENPLDEFDVLLAFYWHKNLVFNSFLQEPPVIGRAAFVTLYDLSRESLSYVCLRDRDGNRWFANIAIGELRQSVARGSNPGGYVATLHVRELTRVPSTPTDPTA